MLENCLRIFLNRSEQRTQRRDSLFPQTTYVPTIPAVPDFILVYYNGSADHFVGQSRYLGKHRMHGDYVAMGGNKVDGEN